MNELAQLWLAGFGCGALVSGGAYVATLIGIFAAEVGSQSYWDEMRKELRAFLRCHHVKIPDDGEVAIIFGSLEGECLGSLHKYLDAQLQTDRMSVRVHQVRNLQVGVALIIILSILFATFLTILAMVGEKPSLIDAMTVYGVLVALLISIGVAMPVFKAKVEIRDMIAAMSEAEEEVAKKAGYLTHEIWIEQFRELQANSR